ncbi:hypothetical protein AGIG_G4975 [Arapaima gigas]
MVILGGSWGGLRRNSFFPINNARFCLPRRCLVGVSLTLVKDEDEVQEPLAAPRLLLTSLLSKSAKVAKCNGRSPSVFHSAVFGL